MAQRTDLYSVLYSYAKKTGSPHIDMEAFISFLEKYAKKVCEDKPEWAKWAYETGKKVWTEANHLADEGKLIFDGGNAKPKVHFNYYHAEAVREAYKNPDEDADRPFPNEDSLNITVPKEQLKHLYIEGELAVYLKDPQHDLLPIIKLILPANAGNFLVLAPMLPDKLMEFSLLKMRKYLLRQGNKEYVQRRLAPQLTGKESALKEILDQIQIRPNECLNDLKKFREVSFYFWAHFCNLVRTDLLQKTERLDEDNAALQASYVIDSCASLYKTKAAKAKETELAFKAFELEMEKPPFYFSRQAISKFKDNKGTLIMDLCGANNLDEYIRKRSTETANQNELPDMVYFYTNDGNSWLVKKTKTLSACAKLLADARPSVIKAIHQRWKIMLKEYRKENAMDNDRDFESLVAHYTREYAPMLQAILDDKKLFLIYQEMQAKKNVSDSAQLFNKNELLPMRVLLNIKRRQILGDVKLTLPFWNSLFFNLIAFFKRGNKKKTVKNITTQTAKEKSEDDPYKELRNSAAELQKRLVPQNQSLDSFIVSTGNRWAERLNKQASEDLIEDVNTLIRDKFRMMLRMLKRSAISKDALETMAETIFDGYHSLRNIRDQEGLLLYIKLYLIKLLTRSQGIKDNP